MQNSTIDISWATDSRRNVVQTDKKQLGKMAEKLILLSPSKAVSIKYTECFVEASFY